MSPRRETLTMPLKCRRAAETPVSIGRRPKTEPPRKPSKVARRKSCSRSSAGVSGPPKAKQGKRGASRRAASKPALTGQGRDPLVAVDPRAEGQLDVGPG